MKIEFVNGAELIVPEFADPIDVAKTYSTLSDIGKEFVKFAPENVSTIKAYDDDGELIAQFDGMYFGGVRIENLATDEGVKFEAHFTFRQKTQMEIMAEQIAALQASQDLQDGAIEDLADTVYA